jgi:beta-phosphoglucomutase-like phosphatase (HAD superfamily)
MDRPTRALGLPDRITAGLFDVDGVLTSPAELHRQAWKQTFDEMLRERDGDHFREFTDRDYAGVQAARAGRFGPVIGVDRAGQAEALRERGADVVVTDLADLLQEVR